MAETMDLTYALASEFGDNEIAQQAADYIERLRDENAEIRRATEEATKLVSFYEDILDDILWLAEKAKRGMR